MLLCEDMCLYTLDDSSLHLLETKTSNSVYPSKTHIRKIRVVFTKYWPLIDTLSEVTNLRICEKPQISKHIKKNKYQGKLDN